MPSSLTDNQRGILAVCACMGSYTVNDVLVKQILLTAPAGEVILVRGVMCSLLIAAVAAAFGHARSLFRTPSRTLVWRSLAEGLSTAGFIAALAHLNLANVAAVLQVAPLIITVLSVLLYREVVGWRRWSAISIGFIGALLVIKPVPSEFNAWALVAVASAVAAAAREVLTRRIGYDTPVLVVAFWGAVTITFCGAALAPIEAWRPFTTAELLQLLVAAVFVSLAIFLLALAFRDVDLSVVAPFRYSYLLTSALGGYLVFREVPDAWTVAGAALIVGSGLYTLHREAVRRRSLTGTATAAL